jgi:hypothetical protein
VDIPDPSVLREYALLADGWRGIVIGPHGDMNWGCFPRWDSDPVFGALLGAEGFYRLEPRERHSWGGHYEWGTLIWHSRWVTTEADVECRTALAYPGDEHRAVILRRLTSTRGPSRVDVALQLRRSFGAGIPTRVKRDDDGRWTMRVGDLHVRWSGVSGARYDEASKAFRGTIDMRPDERADLVLEISDEPLGKPVDVVELWDGTELAWRNAARPRPGLIAARDCEHAAAVLRGLTAPTGAMVAAATMSLPERAGGDRDYDYRYAWLRDQCFVGEAAAAVGLDDLLQDAVGFVTARVLADGPKLRPAYRVDGGSVPGQKEIALPGYPGSPHVVCGNRAGTQFQLDVFGEVLLLLAAAAEQDRLDADGWQAAVVAAEAIADRWEEPDAGIWETEPRLYAHSRLICAAGLRRIASVGVPGPQTGQWTALADKLLAEAAASSVHTSGRWMRAPDDERCDSALLLPQIRGLLPPEDPRSAATRDYVLAELTQDGYVYRYQVYDRPLGIAEGAFLLCGYWLSMAVAQAGKPVEARALFERSRAACGPPGLFTEEFDVEQRQCRGNLPQAFVHATMLEAAAKLSDL